MSTMQMTRQGSPAGVALAGFIVGAVAVVIGHQVMVLVLHLTGFIPNAPCSFRPNPWGVPALINSMFWGGLWGVLYAFVVFRQWRSRILALGTLLPLAAVASTLVWTGKRDREEATDVDSKTTKTFPIGLSQLIEVMELDGMISATDVYPIFIGESNFHQLLLVNETTKAQHNPQQPLFSIEFQEGGNSDFGAGQSSFYDLHTRLCISTGMRAINHYLFCDGENDPVLSPIKRHDWGHPVRKDGTLRKHYYRYPKLSKVLNVYGTDLILSQPQTVATIGFLLNHFMTAVNNALTQESTHHHPPTRGHPL